MRKLRVVLAGGGTAGHVNPLLATADLLHERGHSVVVVGTAEGLEANLVPAAGFRLVSIPKVPIPRRPSKDLFSVPTRLRAAVAKASDVVEGADVVVGFGGYVAAPVYLAAKRLGVPFVIHEQNVKAGWANKMGARNAAALGLTFPQTNLVARRGATEVTGMPLRRSIMELAAARRSTTGAWESRTLAAKHFGLDPAVPTLVVTGGSLGAQSINQVVLDCVPRVSTPVQVLHITGIGKADPAREAARHRPDVTWVIREYAEDMDLVLATADLVLCRAGAGTVAELTALGMPAVYVPYPVGNGEQALNAAAQVEAGGALLVYDQDFTSATFEELVLPLLGDADRLERMRKASRSVSPGDGAENLVLMIEAAV